MALTDKDIVITPNRGQSADPKVEFKGASSTLGPQTISLNVYPTSNGTLSFEGSAGQLFSITNTLTGTIYSVNDVSGIPSIEVLDTGLVKLAQYSGNVLVGTGTDDGSKLQVRGSLRVGNGGWNSSPAGTTFSHTIAANTGNFRTVNFDGNGNTPSVWWTNGSRPYGAIDAQDPGLTFWAHNGSGWQKQITMNYGTVNIDTALQQGGNQVLHAGNYNSYAPTLTGGNASGTWGINITGSAATATDSTKLPLTGGTITGTIRIDGGGSQPLTISTSSSSPWAFGLIRTDTGADSKIFLHNPGSGSAWIFEHIPYFYNGGNYNVPLHNGNYGSYALPLSGGTMTGIITTVSSGTAINFSGQSDSIGYNGSSGLGTYIRGTSATYVYGGGSFYDGSAQRAILHANNYSSYALPLSGGTLTGSLTLGRDLIVNGNTGGNYSNRVIIGAADTSYTLQDTNLRPTLHLHGQYPVVSLNHTVTSNTNHGPTLQFTSNGTGSQFVIGTNGTGTMLSMGYSSGTDWNPHNGIAGYNGTSFFQAGTNGYIGIGSQGDWSLSGGTGTHVPGYNLHFIGSNNATSGHAAFFDNRVNGANNGSGFLFRNLYGNHSWGIVAEYRVEGTAGGDRPSILFSHGYNSYTWSVGFGSSDDQFRINQNHGHRNGDWGTERFRIDTGGTPYFNGNVALHAGNYTSYSPPYSGGVLTGTWYFRSNLGNSSGATSNPPLQAFSSDGNSAFMSFHRGGYYAVNFGLDSDNVLRIGGWSASVNRWQLDMDGNNIIPGRLTANAWTTSARNYSNEWIEFPNYSGLYSPQNNAHFYPNNATYGSWRIAGTRNGWYGIYFDSGSTLMMNSAEVGFYRQDYGWQMRWYAGTGYISKGNPGGGTEATILDSSNYTNYSHSISISDSRYHRKDTTSQWVKPYYEYGNYLTTETPQSLVSQMGGGGLRVDFMHPSYTGSGGWNHVITWSGYNLYNMYQLGGNYDGGTGTDLWVRSEANHGGTSWTAWRRLLNSSNYNSYSPTLTGGGASGTWSINITGSASYATTAGDANSVDGYDSTTLMGAQARKEWSSIYANGAQARRWTIARVYGTPNHWINIWQNIRIKIVQEDYSSGYAEYNLIGYYGMGNGNSWILRLKEADGFNTDYFQVSLGTVTAAGWNYAGQPTYYQDVYIDVNYYTTVRIIATTYGHGYQSTNPTDGSAGCYTVFYDSPSASDISYSNVSKANTYHFDSVILNSGNYNSYSPTLTGGGASGTWGINISGSLTSSAPQLAAATESNSIYVSAPNYTTGSPVKLLNFDWYGNTWAIGNIRSGSSPSDGFGVYFQGSERGRWSSSGYGFQVGTALGYDNPGGWGANIVAAGTYHARLRLKATSYNSSGDRETYLWLDNTVSPATGMYSSAPTFNFNGSISTVQVAGNTVLHAGNYNSYSPTLTGGGASGTWSINITGSAATATDSTKVPLSGGTMTGTLFINSKLRVNNASGPSDNTYGTAADIPFHLSGNNTTQTTLLIENTSNTNSQYPQIVIRRTGLSSLGSTRTSGLIKFTETDSAIYGINSSTSSTGVYDLVLESGTNDSFIYRVVLRAGTSSNIIVGKDYVVHRKAANYQVVSLNGGVSIDCSQGNFFTTAISSDSTFTFSNVISTGDSLAYSFTLELAHSAGTVTWPASVKWPGNVLPSLTTGKTHLFMFVTRNGGSRWRGSFLSNYDT